MVSAQIMAEASAAFQNTWKLNTFEQFLLPSFYVHDFSEDVQSQDIIKRSMFLVKGSTGSAIQNDPNLTKLPPTYDSCVALLSFYIYILYIHLQTLGYICDFLLDATAMTISRSF